MARIQRSMPPKIWHERVSKSAKGWGATMLECRVKKVLRRKTQFVHSKGLYEEKTNIGCEVQSASRGTCSESSYLWRKTG